MGGGGIYLPEQWEIRMDLGDAVFKADKDGNLFVEGSEIEELKGILRDKFCIETPQDIITQLDRITGWGKTTEPDQRIDLKAVNHFVSRAEERFLDDLLKYKEGQPLPQRDPLLELLQEKTCKPSSVA